MYGQPHSIESGSIQIKLTNRASCIYPIFHEDNKLVYHRLEEAVRGTSYSALLRLYQQTKDGRGYFQSIISHYAGEDKR